ncbi:MAG: hypothetical protein ABWY57_09290 [Mycetocola sp.]
MPFATSSDAARPTGFREQAARDPRGHSADDQYVAEIDSGEPVHGDHVDDVSGEGAVISGSLRAQADAGVASMYPHRVFMTVGYLHPEAKEPNERLRHIVHRMLSDNSGGGP